MDTNEVGMESLPDEMLIKIFSYLSQNKLGQIALVCRRWNAITKTPVLWREVSIKLAESHGCQTTAAIAVVNSLPELVTSIKFNFVSTSNWKRDWTDLDYEKLAITLEDRCPNLMKLTVKNGKLTHSLPSVIELSTQFLQQIIYLKFDNSRFSECSVRQFCETSKIESLCLPFCKLQRFNDPPFSRMPCLKKLILWGTEWDQTYFDYPFFFKQLHVLHLGNISTSPMIFYTIQQHAVNLKELYLCITGIRDNFFSQSSFPHLETICLVHCRNVTVMGFVTLIQSSQCLKNIYVLPKVAELCETNPFLVENNRLQIIKPIVSCKSHVF